MYMYMYVCIHICVYIYIYMYYTYDIIAVTVWTRGGRPPGAQGRGTAARRCRSPA